MITLSVCMIVKNEHDTLARCLDCANKFADEIIVVDTGSTDDTKDIAIRYTEKVYDFKWVEDFSKARNYSFSKANMEYIMWLDADDVILDEDILKIKNLKESLDRNTDMVCMKYNLNLDENGIPALSYYRERIVKRDQNYKWISPIHEVIPRQGNVIYEDIAITHKKEHASSPDRNLKIFEKMKKEKHIFDARQSFYYARELMYAKRYNDAILEYTNFLSRNDGWIENKISACLDLSDIYSSLGNNDKSLEWLFYSFKYSSPRAEVCSKIAFIFILNRKWDIAINWLEQALKDRINIASGGFFIKDYYDFIPYINLGYCYYNLNDITKAIYYNELAGKIKPNNAVYIKNKEAYAKKTEN